ncbi:hypothetical protein ACFC1R_23650 [Kitasatospora sp. NPDC056138]|uniref:hypothetical protein n=1 Tax=Kitasatospora sp. NPDC056138 TaxID=3345724 RepID=UPI0035D59EB5
MKTAMSTACRTCSPSRTLLPHHTRNLALDTTDIAIGRHPKHGIVATNPRDLPASQWMLERLGFQPVPDHPQLYTLANQTAFGRERAAQAVGTLRSAGYTVATDAEFEPDAPIRPRPRHHLAEPDITFAEHPQLGVIAATADTAHAAVRGVQMLEQHGWRHNAQLDLYTMPITIHRSEALGRVAQATMVMQRTDLLVAVEPRLAQDVATRQASAPATNARQGLSTGRVPVSAAALAASPAVAGLPGKTAVPVPAAASTSRPVDPRIATVRSH